MVVMSLPPFSTPIPCPLGKMGIIYTAADQRRGRVDVLGDRCTRMPRNTWVRFRAPQTRELLSLSLPSVLEDLGTRYLLSESRESLEPEPRA